MDKNYKINNTVNCQALALGHATDFNMSFALVDLATDVLETVRTSLNDSDELFRECLNIDELIDSALDRCIISSAIQWEMLRAYCTPEEAIYADAVSDFSEAILHIIEEHIITDYKGIVTAKMTGINKYDILVETIGEYSINAEWFGSIEDLQLYYWDYELIIED